ncbi:response regulator, partial [Halorubrum sp. SP3]
LIIEDDREEVAEYADWLEEYVVRTAVDGERALDALDADVDVVLLDGELADPTAEELLGRIRARRPDCQIGLLSGMSVGDDVLRLDTDEYVRFRATVAQPIVQPYFYDGEVKY